MVDVKIFFMDIRKSLELDLFGDVIPEEKVQEKLPEKPVTVLRGTFTGLPVRPYSVHRISPTEVWIIHEDEKPLPG